MSEGESHKAVKLTGVRAKAEAGQLSSEGAHQIAKVPRTWGHQYERVQRWYGRLKEITEGITPSGPTDRLEDDALAFFQNCHHLKDWLRNDASTGVSNAELNAYLKANGALKLCQELCNGTKHLIPELADLGPKTIHVALHEGSTGQGPTVSMSFLVVTPDGEAKDAYGLATECMELWKKFLGERGLMESLPTCEGTPPETAADSIIAAERARKASETR